MDFVKLHLDTRHKLYGAALNTSPLPEQFAKITDRTFYSLKVLAQEEDSRVWSWGLILEETAEQERFRRAGWHNAQFGNVYECGEQLIVGLT